MGIQSDVRNTDPSILLALVLLLCVFSIGALGVHALSGPSVVPNPGLAAYEPPTAIKILPPTPPDVLMAMETSAQVAAAENRDSGDQAKTPDRKSKQAARTNVRKRHIASGTTRYARRIPWGFAENPYSSYGSPYSSYGRWF